MGCAGCRRTCPKATRALQMIGYEGDQELSDVTGALLQKRVMVNDGALVIDPPFRTAVESCASCSTSTSRDPDATPKATCAEENSKSNAYRHSRSSLVPADGQVTRNHPVQSWQWHWNLVERVFT